MPLKCQVYYPIFSYVVLRLYIRGSRSGIFHNTFFLFVFTLCCYPNSKKKKFGSVLR